MTRKQFDKAWARVLKAENAVYAKLEELTKAMEDMADALAPEEGSDE